MRAQGGLQKGTDVPRREPIIMANDYSNQANLLADRLMGNELIKRAVATGRLEVAAKVVAGQWVAQLLILDADSIGVEDWLEISPVPCRYQGEVAPRLRWWTKATDEEGRVLLSPPLDSGGERHPYDVIINMVASYVRGDTVIVPFERDDRVVNRYRIRCLSPVR